MCGGGGNTTSTGTTVTKNEPPEYIQPYSIDLANRASDLSKRPYQAYGGEQVAPLTSAHEAGMHKIYTRSTFGDATFNAANSQARNTLNGDYLGKGAYQNQGLGIGNQYLSNIASQQGQRNSEMNNGWAYGIANQQGQRNSEMNNGWANRIANQQGQRNSEMNNGWAYQVANQKGQRNSEMNNGWANKIANQKGQRNALAGVGNPYLNKVIANTNADIVRTFQNSTMPQTDASFARSGAFGGSAWQQANAENNRQMTNELLKNESNLRMADYNNQLQLAENLANRNQQADADNRDMLASYYQGQQSLAENLAIRNQQADTANRDMLASYYQGQQSLAENLANRKQQADAANKNMLASYYQGQQSLAENLANRDQQADAANRNMLASYYQGQQSLAENLANRNQQADAFNRQAYLTDYAQRQDAAESYAQRQSDAWNAERARQMGMVGTGQALSNQAYTDAQNMLGVGDIQRDYRQTINNQAYQNFLNQQNWPLQNLDILANAIRTSMGAGGTTTQTASMPSVNRTANMVGGAMTGYSLGSALGGSDSYGGALGAGAGALAGLLG